jgi:hypothetical protein
MKVIPIGEFTSPSYTDRLTAWVDARRAEDDARPWQVLWSSNADPEFGATAVVTLGDGWAVAVKLRSDPSQRILVEELRILPAGNFAGGKAPRSNADRAFWMSDEGDEFLAREAPPEHPIPGNGVTTGVLRKIPFAEIIQSLSLGLADNVEAFSLEPDAEDWAERQVPLERRKRGGSDRGDLFYAEVAAAFVNLLRTGERRPISVIAERHQFSPNTIKSWIAQARARGLLESRGKGQPGGNLTERARTILKASSNGQYPETAER